MMRVNRTMLSILGLAGLFASAWTQGTAFTYQGFLRQGGTPANAYYDFQFSLWTAASGGISLGTINWVNVPVQSGLFTVSLDFGAVWDGSERYLQIAVRPTGTGSYTTLSPRVKINPTPYAIRAGSASPIGLAGGDLSGSYPNPTVARLQGRSVSPTAPSAGQVLKWDGSAWAPATDIGLTLPFSGSSSVLFGAAFSVTNTSTDGTAVGVYGQSNSTSGTGVFGRATATSGENYGGYFQSDSTSGRGVLGLATATSGETYGMRGESRSTSGRGVFGAATATSGFTYGGWFESASSSGTGVYGGASATSGTTYGVYGWSHSTSGTGVFGWASAASGTTHGGWFQSRSSLGIGVVGYVDDLVGSTVGVKGVSDSTSGTGILGLVTATTGATYGGRFQSASTSGIGVFGWATATTGATYGGRFESASTSGMGVLGWASATSGSTYGVYGQSDSTSGRGVYGYATATSGATVGVRGESRSTFGDGVVGLATATSGAAWGARGTTSSPASNAYGVIGQEPSGGAGHAVYAEGTLAATGTKSFQIDHPLSPETHYLNHFCTEAPEPLNAYTGVVTLDARGEAWVQLPNYFEAINRDPRYTLTPIGAPMPNLHVAVEIQGNRFKIAGGVPGKKVSWEVKAVRNDLWVRRYGFQTEQEKEDDIKGKYLHPELYGQPKVRGIHYRPEPEPTPNETANP